MSALQKKIKDNQKEMLSLFVSSDNSSFPEMSCRYCDRDLFTDRPENCDHGFI